METMETTLRRQIPDLIEEIYSKPYEFELAQALKVFEYFYPDNPEVGEPDALLFEKIVFKSRVNLSTAASDVYKIYDENSKIVVVVNMMGIAGIQGPLPTPYTEWIIDQLNKRDTAFADFLDIFNHRFISIKTKILKCYTPTLSKKQPHLTTLGRTVASLTGLENYKSDNSIRRIVKYAGLMWGNSHSAAGFKAMVSDYFGVRTAIRLLEERWFNIEPEDRTYIGQQNCELGINATVGRRVRNSNTMFRLTLGSMNGFMFRQFLKNGKAYKELLNIGNDYLPQGQKFYINLIINENDVTQTRLDGKSELGWTSWIYEKKPKGNDAQVFLFQD
jgi:type VI secretion system protein ImpH